MSLQPISIGTITRVIIILFRPATQRFRLVGAAMKYLGDSLVGLRYSYSEEKKMEIALLVIEPTGDPSFSQRNSNESCV